jgi:hypothetical protein
MPQAETGKAVQVFDLLLEYFGEEGERWTRDRYDDSDGRRCLVRHGVVALSKPFRRPDVPNITSGEWQISLFGCTQHTAG